jgi:hypothetical protein
MIPPPEPSNLERVLVTTNNKYSTRPLLGKIGMKVIYDMWQEVYQLTLPVRKTNFKRE